MEQQPWSEHVIGATQCSDSGTEPGATKRQWKHTNEQQPLGNAGSLAHRLLRALGNIEGPSAHPAQFYES